MRCSGSQLLVAAAFAALPCAHAAVADWAPLLTPPGGPGVGADGYVLKTTPAHPTRGGYFVCGNFSGLNGVVANAIAYVADSGDAIALAGSTGAVVGTCTAAATDPLDPDALYIGLSPGVGAMCGTAALPTAAGLCKWSWADRSWTLLATASGSAGAVSPVVGPAIIRSIAIVGANVWLGGEFSSGCSSVSGTFVSSPNFCKIVSGAVTAALNPLTNVRGVSAAASGATAVRAIIPVGTAAPPWLPASGADLSTAAFVCGEFAGAGGVRALGYLFIAANNASDARNTVFLPLMYNGTAPVAALDKDCAAAVPVPATGVTPVPSVVFGGSFNNVAGGSLRSPKLVSFDGIGMRTVAPSLPADLSNIFYSLTDAALSVDPMTGTTWLYALWGPLSLNSLTVGYIFRVNMTSGATGRLLPPSGVPGVQLVPTSISFAAAPCSFRRAQATASGCAPLSLAGLPDGRVVVGGTFDRVNGATPANGLAVWAQERWALLGTAGAGANDVVYASAQLGSGATSMIVLGGGFTFVGNVSARAAAVVRLSDGLTPGYVLPLTPALANAQGTPNAFVRAVLPVAGGFFLTGRFSGPGLNLAFCAVNAASGMGAPPSPLCSALTDASTSTNGLTGSTFTPTGWALALYGGDLIVGGEMSTCGGVANTNSICRWRQASSSFGPLAATGSGARLATSSKVYALAVDEARGVLYIGGSFVSLTDGTLVYSVVAWNGTAFLPMAQTPPPFATSGLSGGDVNALAFLNDVLYLGGSFTAVASGAGQLGRLAGFSVTNQTFFQLLFQGASALNGGGVDGQVLSAVGDPLNNAVFFGGHFSGCPLQFGVLPATCNRLVRYAPTTGLTDMMSELLLPLPSTNVYSLALLPDSRSIVVGGVLGLSPNGAIPLNNVALFNISVPPRVLPTPDATPSASAMPTVSASALPSPSRTPLPSPLATVSSSLAPSASGSAAATKSGSSAATPSPSLVPSVSGSSAATVTPSSMPSVSRSALASTSSSLAPSAAASASSGSSPSSSSAASVSSSVAASASSSLAPSVSRSALASTSASLASSAAASASTGSSPSSSSAASVSPSMAASVARSMAPSSSPPPASSSAMMTMTPASSPSPAASSAMMTMTPMSSASASIAPAGASPTASTVPAGASASASPAAAMSPGTSSAPSSPAVSASLSPAAATQSKAPMPSASPVVIRVGALLQLSGIPLSSIVSSSNGLLSLRPLLQRLQVLLTAGLASAPGVTQPVSSTFVAGIELLYVQDRRTPTNYLVPASGDTINSGLAPVALAGDPAGAGGAGSGRRAQSTSSVGVTLSLAVSAMLPGLTAPVALSVVSAVLSMSNPAAISAVTAGAATLATDVGVPPSTVTWSGASAAQTPAAVPGAPSGSGNDGGGSGGTIGAIVGTLVAVAVVAGLAYYVLAVRSRRSRAAVAAPTEAGRKSVFMLRRPTALASRAGSRNNSSVRPGATAVVNPLGLVPPSPVAAPAPASPLHVELGNVRGSSNRALLPSAAGPGPAAFAPAPVSAVSPQPRASRVSQMGMASKLRQDVPGSSV